MPAASLPAAPAADLARWVQAGELTPLEVVDAHLERVERLERRVGAFVTLRAEAARAEARQLAAHPELRRLPLAGVPVAVKDNVDVAGEPTRWGSRATSARPADADDPSVARLRRAGAIVIGKTKLPELAAWAVTEPAADGPAHNPWRLDRTPGGSSGGSAAAVAAGFVPLALGSDGGGSIRVPAACCGVFGLKPGPDVVEIGPRLREHWLGLTGWGPLAFTVEDAALGLAVLSDRPAELPPPRRLRIAVSLRPPEPTARTSPDVREAVVETARLLQELGHQVVAADPPFPPFVDLRWMTRWLAGLATDAAALDGRRLEPATRSLVRWGRLVERAGLARPAAADGFHRRARAWLAGYDLLLTAATSSPAVAVGHWPAGRWLRRAWGQGNWVWTLPWSLAQVPAAAVPARISREGLPVGVQLVAGPGGEGTLLAAAAELEQVRPWRRAPLP